MEKNCNRNEKFMHRHSLQAAKESETNLRYFPVKVFPHA